MTDRYVADLHPRGPYYVPQIPEWRKPEPGAEQPVYRYWPVLTPDGGIMFASTETDAQRIAATLNELLDLVDELTEMVRHDAQD